METRVKICGLTRFDDAERAVAAGAWAIGMVMWEGSRRRCEPQAAAEIAEALRRKVEVVGVFVNASLDELGAAADAIPFTMLQLHGDEGPSYCAEAARATGLRIIKAARVRDGASVRELGAFKTDFHLLDAHVDGEHGGTGQSFDWSLAREHGGAPPLILSGGLTPDNVADAIAAVAPFAVDVASGVEAGPGIKDPHRMQQFFDAVRGTAVAV